MVVRSSRSSSGAKRSATRRWQPLVALAVVLVGSPCFAGRGHTAGGPEASPSPFTPPVAPGLTTETAHAAARAALATVLAVLPANERTRLAGMYVAFDADAAAPSALAACDDDGDYVVVLNEALLSLVDFAAQLEATDELSGTHALSSYAELLNDTGGRVARVPPPPAGEFVEGRFFPGEALREALGALERARYTQALEALIAHEVAHAVRNDVQCPHPTPTHEAGDDTWTPQEQLAAIRLASATYTETSVAGADALAVSLLLRLAQLRGDRQGDAMVSAATAIETLGALTESPYARHHDRPYGIGSDPAAGLEARDARIEALRTSATRWAATQCNDDAPSPASSARTLR